MRQFPACWIMSRLPLLSPAEEEVLIGLGGNIGDPLGAMRHALESIGGHMNCRVLRVSSVWKTPPWGVTDQPDFLNACAAIETTLAPHAFLKFCLSVEQQLKRVRDLRWGPRSIDLDILFFGKRIINEPGLIVPHPRFAERAFVLVPLAEIAPVRLYHGQTIDALAARSDATGMSKFAEPDWISTS
jgi:2-amino-4-hydroxy-6-hydroxymethyldihydropteridine diphosphokinase